MTDSGEDSAVDQLAAVLMARWEVDDTDEDAYDAVCADLAAIPDGWAKVEGEWVRLAQVGTVHHDHDGWPLFSGTTPSDKNCRYIPHCPVYRIVDANG